MSRLFNGATNYRRLEKTGPSGIPLNAPYSAAIRYRPASLAANAALLQLADLASLNNLWMLYTNNSGNIVWRIRTTTSLNIIIAGPIVVGTWNSMVASNAADNSHRWHWCPWRDTLSSITNTTSKAPGAQSSPILAVGVDRANGSTTNWPANGDIADAAVWNIALGDEEVRAFVRGVSPLRIRPASLVSYWPLLGLASPEPDYRVGGANTLTLVNSPPASLSPPTAFRWAPALGMQGIYGHEIGVGIAAELLSEPSVGLAFSPLVGVSAASSAGPAASLTLYALAQAAGVTSLASLGGLAHATAIQLALGAGLSPSSASGFADAIAMGVAAAVIPGVAIGFGPALLAHITARLATDRAVRFSGALRVAAQVAALLDAQESGAGVQYLDALVRLVPELAGMVGITPELDAKVRLAPELDGAVKINHVEEG